MVNGSVLTKLVGWSSVNGRMILHYEHSACRPMPLKDKYLGR